MAHKRIDALTGGRFFAMLLIVASHFEFLTQYSIGPVYSRYIHNPTLGVDYFFLLSGFGMMLSTLRKPASPEDTGLRPKDLIGFAIRHIRKIYPFYLAALGLGIVYELVSLSLSGNGINLLLFAAKTVIKLIPCLLLVQSATGISSFSHALCATCWFLSSLFCIYLISPVLIKLLRKYIRSIRSSVICLILLAGASALSASVFGWIEERSFFDMLVYASPYRRVLYVAYGMVLAIMYCIRKETSAPFWEYIAIPLAGIYFFLRTPCGVFPRCGIAWIC